MYQLRIIRCGIIIAFGVWMVNQRSLSVHCKPYSQRYNTTVTRVRRQFTRSRRSMWVEVEVRSCGSWLWSRNWVVREANAERKIDRVVCWHPRLNCRRYVHFLSLSRRQKITPFYFCNNFVKPHDILIIFGAQSKFATKLQQNCHLSWWVFLRYLVKYNMPFC